MKNKISISQVALLLVAGALGGTPLAQAGALGLSLSTVDGGGGISRGSSPSGLSKFTLSATIGQPDAGVCAGNGVLVQGGFIPAFIKIPLPPLRLSPSGADIVVQWADSCPGIHLEGSADIAASSWIDLGIGALQGADRLVQVPNTGYLFFRLHKACAGGCPTPCRE